MKKCLKILMALSLIVLLSACGGKENPYESKEYEKLEVTDNFSQDFAQLFVELGTGMTELSDTVQANMNNLNSGSTIAELDVFSDSYDKLYEICYKIDNLDENKIPEDFKEALKYSKEVSKDTKSMLNDAYNWDFKDGNPTEQYVGNISANLTNVQNSIPRKELKLNEQYDFGLVDFKLTSKPTYSKNVKPKNDSISYYKTEGSNTFFQMRFEMTNKTTDDMEANDLVTFKLVFDEQYEYAPTLFCEQNSFFSYYTTLKPLEKVKGWVACEVPETVKNMDYVLTVTCDGVEYIYK